MKKYTSSDPMRGEIDLGEDFGMEGVVEYLNEVLKKWGPPCEWCKNWGEYTCEKGHRPRTYDMKYGQWEVWTLRKHCKDHDGIESENAERTSDVPLQRVVGGTYGGTNTSIMGNVDFNR